MCPGRRSRCFGRQTASCDPCRCRPPARRHDWRTISSEKPACVDKYYRPISLLRSKRTGTPCPDRISRSWRRGLFGLGSAPFSNEVDDAAVAVQVATGLDLGKWSLAGALLFFTAVGIDMKDLLQSTRKGGRFVKHLYPYVLRGHNFRNRCHPSVNQVA